MEDFAPEKKKKYIEFYMNVAKNVANMSYAKRLKVGSILVKDGNIISFGWNGMPSGWDNNCEDEVINDVILKSDEIGTSYPIEYTKELKTKPEVIHAEMNCLLKVAKSNNSSKDSVMFLTHSPCIDCAKQIFTAGINKLYFGEHYRSTEGIQFLKKCNIKVEQCQVGDIT